VTQRAAGRMPCRWGGPHNCWVAIIGEWRSGFGNVAVNVRHAGGLGHRGLGTDWLAQVHQHDLGWVWAWQRGELAGLSTWHGTEGCTPSSSIPWRPRGCGAAVSAPVDRHGCWAWPRCECEWCSTWTSNPTEVPGARRDAACQILRKPAVRESPFLRAHYQQCTQCGTL
jgi:hypothetical protein